MYSGFFLLSIIIQLAHLTPPKAFGAVGACTDSYRQIPSGPTSYSLIEWLFLYIQVWKNFLFISFIQKRLIGFILV